MEEPSFYVELYKPKRKISTSPLFSFCMDFNQAVKVAFHITEMGELGVHHLLRSDAYPVLNLITNTKIRLETHASCSFLVGGFSYQSLIKVVISFYGFGTWSTLHCGVP
jgi:hypothetical protein